MQRSQGHFSWTVFSPALPLLVIVLSSVSGENNINATGTISSTSTELPIITSTEQTETTTKNETQTLDQFPYVEDIVDNDIDLKFDLNKTELSNSTTTATTTTSTSTTTAKPNNSSSSSNNYQRKAYNKPKHVPKNTSTVNKRPNNIPQRRRPQVPKLRPTPTSMISISKRPPVQLSSLSNITSRVVAEPSKIEYTKICTLGARLVPAQCFNCHCDFNGNFNAWTCTMDGACMAKKQHDASAMARNALGPRDYDANARNGVATEPCQRGYHYQDGCKSCMCAENGFYQCRDICSRTGPLEYAPRPTFYASQVPQYPQSTYPGWAPPWGAGSYPQNYNAPVSNGYGNPFVGAPASHNWGYPYATPQMNYGRSNLTNQRNKVITKRTRMNQQNL